jgi:lipid-A-disaccharide synthase-like uncharacterized protein
MASAGSGLLTAEMTKTSESDIIGFDTIALFAKRFIILWTIIQNDSVKAIAGMGTRGGKNAG